jgi:hypothetical protein
MTVDLDEFTDIEGVLNVLANGYFGHTDLFYPSNLHLTKKPDGSYSFTTGMKFENEQKDDVVGTIENRHIVFTRTRTGTDAFVQKYDGWLFESLRPDLCVAQMAGTFSHNGSTLYGWCGWFVKTRPS